MQKSLGQLELQIEKGFIRIETRMDSHLQDPYAHPALRVLGREEYERAHAELTHRVDRLNDFRQRAIGVVAVLLFLTSGETVYLLGRIFQVIPQPHP